MNPSQVSTPSAATACRPGKFLNFQLSGEFYGLELSKVREIVGMMKVTRVPNSPAFVRGMVNLRGKVIPVIDLRLKFCMEAKADTERTCIIVTQVQNEAQHVTTTGIIVDEVCEVLDIKEDQIEPAPSLGADVSTDVVIGIGKVASKVILLLDCNKVTHFAEVSTVSPAGAAAREPT
jgi:purine-binding chemotaxis protein CheW